MESAIFNTPVLQVESLKAKFDTLVLSNSFITLIGDYVEAIFLHQLHYWSYSEYGVMLEGKRWIYKAVRDWVREVFNFLSEWKIRKAIASLIEKGLIERKKLYVRHHEVKHDNPWWNPKNQTYYYTINYERLQELIEEAESQEKAGSTEKVRFVNSTKLSSEEINKTKFCDYSQNSTDITSIEKLSKYGNPPNLPCEGEEKKDSNQEKEFDSSNRSEGKEAQNFSSRSKPVLKEEKEAGCSTDDVKTRTKAPWENHQEFAAFRKALIAALPVVANARSPRGLANKIIKELEQGREHDYWDEWKAGLPIGTSDQQEWQIEPGVPYPMFIEYLTEKIKRGNNTQTNEQARDEVFRILDKPRQAKAFWGQFKSSVVNVADQVERDRNLGVRNPNTPVWTRQRIEPTIEEAAEAGKKIMAVNGGGQTLEATSTTQLESSKPEEITSDPWSEEEKPKQTMREMLAEKGVKGFCKQMLKVSQAEAEAEEEAIALEQLNRKTHINHMSLEEINKLIKDPVMKAELMPQLWHSDYELITDYLGQIIKVELSELQKREAKRRAAENKISDRLG